MFTNIEKNEKYRDLMSKLKNAIENEYYYEAIFIEYAIAEDRTESLLKHANLPYRDETNNGFKITRKISIIETNKIYNDQVIRDALPLQFFTELRFWIKSRNNLIHNSATRKYRDTYVEEVAKKGYELILILNSKSTKITHYLDDKQKKAV